MENTVLLEDISVPVPLDEEIAWIKAAQADPTEFAPLYRHYVRRVYRYFYSRTGQAAEAEDLTSQTFLEALEGLKRYHHNGPFTAWLFTIARRRGIDHLRRRKPQTTLDEEQSETSTDLLAQVIGEQDTACLRALIAGLKPAEQELLRLRFAAGLGFHEIGRLLGRSEASVKMSLYRLLTRLQGELETRHE